VKAFLQKTISVDVEIPLSGAEIADLFWELDSVAQAEFFNRMGVFNTLSMQLQAVTDSDRLNSSGRVAMARIGEYSQP
jgi:hypothetical protein